MILFSDVVFLFLFLSLSLEPFLLVLEGMFFHDKQIFLKTGGSDHEFKIGFGFGAFESNEALGL